MLTKRIIPCLDVKDGRVVKGKSFVQLRDAGDPVELASFYYQEGADELVFLDISATPEGRDTMVDIVERISEKVFMPLTVGGGIRSTSDMRRMLLAGADKVSLNTAAVERPSLVSEAAERLGSANLIVAVDARRRNPANPAEGWEVFIHGGRTPTGLDALEWVGRVAREGAGEILLTSMDRDGTKDGYDIELTRTITDKVNIPVIASGGVGTLHHLYEGLVDGGAMAVLAASIVHPGHHKYLSTFHVLDNSGN